MVVLTWILGIVGTLGVAGTIAAFVFVPTVAVPIAERTLQTLLGCKPCLIVGLVLAVALTSYWYGRHGEYAKGHTAAIAEIAAEDQTVLARAVEARGAWQKCRSGGGTWNQSTGVCK